MSKFKIGDKVVFNGNIREMYDSKFTIGQTYIVVNNTYDLYVEDLGGRRFAFMNEDNFDRLNENSSQVGTGKLRVMKAQFIDRNGDTITIKRSECRHYYMKKPGQPQTRIKKKQLSGILTGLAAAL